MEERELIDVYDAEGNRVVGQKPRGEVHRADAWHAISFVWNARTEGGTTWLVLQVRSRLGDPFHGHIDAIACGHVLAGERPQRAAAREMAEECGVEIDAESLEAIGVWKVERAGSICSRAIQHHFICRRFVELEELRPTEEASAFVEVRVSDLRALVSGREHRIKVNRSVAFPKRTEVTAESVRHYSATTLESFERAATAIEAWSTGSNWSTESNG